MSIKGSSIKWLEGAIERGDLLTAWSVAHELAPLPLDHALALVVLASADHEREQRFDAAARRWCARYLADARGQSIGELRAFVDCLDELPALDALAGLGALCDRRRFPLTAGALNRLTPSASQPLPQTMPRRRR